MQRNVTFVFLLLNATRVLAAEDGANQCGDGIDNDFDGLTDCAEKECVSARTGCNAVLAEPLLVADSVATIRFDIPMMTVAATVANQDLIVADINGSLSGKDDVIVAASSAINIYRNITTSRYASLPRAPTTVTGFLGNSPRLASGDFDGDGDADLVAVSATRLQRYLGNGAGGFSAQTQTPASALVGGSLPAVAGRNVVAANTSLRVYNPDCTVAPPTPPGFPSSTETFGQAALCASVDLTGTSAAKTITTATLNNRVFVLTQASSSFELWEILRETVTGGMRIYPVRRQLFTLSGITDVAWSPADEVFVLANSTAGSLEARRLTLAAGAASLTTVAGLGPVVVAPVPAGSVELLAHIAIGEFVPGERSVVVTETKTEQLYVLPFSTTSGWKRGSMARTTFNTADNREDRADDVAVGQFNDDGLLDIAVLDQATGNIIIVRQQPAPCLAFIAAESHGWIGTDRSYVEIARYNRQLAREVETANAQRRPASGFRDNQTSTNATLCPARFVDVRANWETFSDRGRLQTGIGRGAWLTSQYIIWTPIAYMPLISPGPALTPELYWASAVFLFVVPPDVTATTARFATGAIGLGFEEFGRGMASAAQVEASTLVNQRIREGVAFVDTLMPPCDGNIYVDLVGHSRGGAVLTHSLRRGFGERANFNFDVSNTLLDVVDPSGGDEWRPWMRCGYIPGDRRIDRVGNETISSFFGNDSSGEVNWAAEDFIDSIPGAVGPAEFIRASVIGLPVGHDRSDLEDDVGGHTFGAFQGPLGNIRHKEFAGDPAEGSSTGIGFMWVNPDETAAQTDNTIRTPSSAVTGGSLFATVSATHIGKFLVDPRGFDTSTAVGFHHDVNFDPTDEASCFPSERACGGTDSCSDVIDDDSGFAANSLDSEGKVVRELVPDFDFRLSAGVVENAVDIVDDYPDLKDIMPGTDAAETRAVITELATAEWVEDGVWHRSGSTLPIIGFDGLSLGKEVGPYVQLPTIDYAKIDTPAEAQTERQRFEDELSNAPGTEGQDRVATLALAAARAASKGDAFVEFGALLGKIDTSLHPASLSASEMLVRVEFEIAPGGTVSVGLKGPGLSASQSWSSPTGTVRSVGELIVQRSGLSLLGHDEIVVKGKIAKVYAVSVRPFLPKEVTSSPTAYEFVLLETGVTQERAASLAARSFWQGKQGRLARLETTDLQSALADKIGADSRGFVDASSSDGISNSFKNSDGGLVPNSLFLSGTSFTSPRPRGAHAFAWEKKYGHRLGHVHPGAAIGGERAGFWVEYPAQGAFASTAQSNGVDALFETVAELFTTADEAPTVSPAPAPDCTADDQSCIDLLAAQDVSD